MHFLNFKFIIHEIQIHAKNVALGTVRKMPTAYPAGSVPASTPHGVAIYFGKKIVEDCVSIFIAPDRSGCCRL